MSIYYSAIAKNVTRLQRFINDFYGTEDREFNIILLPNSCVAYTDLSFSNKSIIYISKNYINKQHILGHEIAHSQLPIKNKLFAEGFASLISCKLAGNCSPFWFSEKYPSDVVRNYFSYYAGLVRLLSNNDEFADFSKIPTRYAHMIAASFIEWSVRRDSDFAKNFLNHISVETELDVIKKYEASIHCYEQMWLDSLGIYIT